MKNQINISNLTREQIEEIRQQIKAYDEQPKTIMDKVKSWEDASKVSIIEKGYFINAHSYIVSNEESSSRSQNKNVVPSEKHAKSILAACQLMVIAEALNEGWKPDYNVSGSKYCVCYDEGEGLVIGYWVSGTYNTIVFKSEVLAEYAMTQFGDLWYDYFMINKPE